MDDQFFRADVVDVETPLVALPDDHLTIVVVEIGQDDIWFGDGEWGTGCRIDGSTVSHQYESRATGSNAHGDD